jgi:hypothetical protein
MFLRFMNAAVHQRSIVNPFGNTLNAKVRESNKFAEWTALAMLVCWACGIFYVLENPINSWIFEQPSIRQVLQFTGAKRIALYLEDFGAPTQKPVELWGTWPGLGRLRLSSLEVRRRVSLGLEPPPKRQKLATHELNGQVNGKAKEMALSSLYPPRFARVVARLHYRIAK